MFKSLRVRVIAIVIIAIGSVITLYQNDGLKLGLDLQGGMHLVLTVDDPQGTMTEDARRGAMDRAEEILRNRIDEFGVEEPLIQRVGTDRLIIELAGISDEEQAKKVIQAEAYLEWKLMRSVEEVNATLGRIDRGIVAALGEDSLRALGRDTRVDVDQTPGIDELLFGDQGDSAAADGATAEGDTSTMAEDPAEVDEENLLRPFSALLLSSGLPNAYLVADEDKEVANLFMELDEFQRALPRDVMLQWDWEPVSRAGQNYRLLHILEEDPVLTGDMLEDAIAGRDPQDNQTQVQFELSRQGGRRFAKTTEENLQKPIAIILDGEVVSTPVVQARISTRGQIDLGRSPLQEAQILALQLRAGALPVPLRIMEERTVGPSLGQDSVDQGTMAGIVGIVLVVLVMISYYRMAGILAVLALGVYVALVLGGLSGLDATLTLPGIAGLILSVGMAVDANVLIFERIREELDLGRATRTAVNEGFANALSAIVDANLTTLITALILFQFGTGAVRGFAVTLSIGIVASFFSALYVTKTFFLLYLGRKKASDPISV